MPLCSPSEAIRARRAVSRQHVVNAGIVIIDKSSLDFGKKKAFPQYLITTRGLVHRTKVLQMSEYHRWSERHGGHKHHRGTAGDADNKRTCSSPSENAHHRVKTRIPPVHRQPLFPDMGNCNYLSHITRIT